MANFRANAAMLVLDPMHVALLAADITGERAGIEHSHGDFAVVPGAARDHGAGRGADIRAIEIEPDALDEGLHVLLAKARIHAGGAALRAVAAGLDTAGERIVGAGSQLGGTGYHLLDMHERASGDSRQWKENVAPHGWVRRSVG